MRGYQALKRSGQLARIAAVKQTLTNHSLILTSQDFSPVVMGRGAESSEIIVRQYLLARCGGLNLNRALLLALGKKQGRVVFYLPREWREVLTLHGFEVARLRSAVLWQLYVCAHLLYGVVTIGKIALAGITYGIVTDSKRKNYVHFADLGPGNLPQEINGSKNHDVISWYLNLSGKTIGIEAVHHSVANVLPTAVGEIAVLPRRGPLPDLESGGAVANYALWGLRACVIAAIDCLRGKWWHGLLLSQAAVAAQVRTLPADSLAREYLFHNSGWIYRPLWTYEAERRGSAVTFYFYSTNCESFKRLEEYPPLPYGWKAMTWPHYLVWDEYQADFVRRAVGEHVNISVVGQIWFQSSAIEMPHFDKPGVAVFDVTPHRQSRYCTLGLDYEFYVPATSNRFLEHIANATRQLDAVMLWKRKRKIGAIAHPHYRHFADRLSERGDVVLVDPDISAQRVIESSCAVISMPFTSTALIARELGKPSYYYDPTGLIQKDDRAAHGIEILRGPEELTIRLRSKVVQ
jgi:polysaccharide biosynthesis PFTS motif protein